MEQIGSSWQTASGGLARVSNEQNYGNARSAAAASTGIVYNIIYARAFSTRKSPPRTRNVSCSGFSPDKWQPAVLYPMYFNYCVHLSNKTPESFIIVIRVYSATKEKPENVLTQHCFGAGRRKTTKWKGLLLSVSPSSP